MAALVPEAGSTVNRDAPEGSLCRDKRGGVLSDVTVSAGEGRLATLEPECAVCCLEEGCFRIGCGVCSCMHADCVPDPELE